MAANNFNENGGRKNYYGVAYGKLSTRVKEVPEGFTEILETELKSKIQAVEEIDLRNKYVKKTGEYPFSVFYDNITGHIVSFKKDEYDKGISFQLTVLDKDGDTSIIQSKFYSKYTENVLNRLLSCEPTSEFNFAPYSIPNTSEIEGKNIAFFNQGISVRVAGEKIMPKHDKDSKDLPPTERVQDTQGKDMTSRVKRINWLFAEFEKMYKDLPAPAPVAKAPQQAPAAPPANAAPQPETFKPVEKSFIPEEHDDLPF